MKKIVYVIGDRFSSFTGIEGAVHYSDWCIIRTGPLPGREHTLLIF